MKSDDEICKNDNKDVQWHPQLTEGTPQIGATVKSEEIKRRIKAAFHRHATVDSAHIQVEAMGGKVKLTGTVRSWTERKDAEDVAWSRPGVTDVENKLEIEQDIYVGE